MNKQKVEKRQKLKLTSDLIIFERERQRDMPSLAVFLPMFLKIYST